jgi:ABC-type Fe3+ transport system permease subunit
VSLVGLLTWTPSFAVGVLVLLGILIGMLIAVLFWKTPEPFRRLLALLQAILRFFRR